MLANLVIAGGLAVLFLVLAARRSRATQPGRLGSLVFKLVLFAVAFVLGEIYLIVWFADLKLPRFLAFVMVTAWGVLLLWRKGSRGAPARSVADASLNK